MMYEDLVRRLRNCATGATACKTCDLKEDGSCSDILMKQAADAIEELRKAVLRLEDESGIYDELPTFYIYPAKWISVAERLPEKPENYPHCELRKCYFLVTLESTAVVSCGYDFENNRWRESFKVTHWMPLPEPPKEE